MFSPRINKFVYLFHTTFNYPTISIKIESTHMFSINTKLIQ